MPNPQFNISSLTPLFLYLKKQQENEKSRRIVELSITFLLISVFLFFAIRPTALTISTLVGDINSKRVLTAQLKTKIDQVITAQDNFSTIQEKYYLVDTALPSNPNFVNALKIVDAATTQNNVFLDKISFAQSDNNFFTSNIATSSSFTSTLGIISSLFANRRIVDIPQISFTQDKDTQSNGQINFIIPIDIFFWNNNEKK
ncbi:MAG: hypothetical protein WC069_03765 [Candidatus Shapirobacteria bacterium]